MASNEDDGPTACGTAVAGDRGGDVVGSERGR